MAGLLSCNIAVIIGDGFAAAVLLVHLARRDFDLSLITVIGTAPLGHGKA